MAAVARRPSAESMSSSGSFFNRSFLVAITSILIVLIFQWPLLSSFISPSWIEAYALCSPGATQCICISAELLGSFFYRSFVVVITSIATFLIFRWPSLSSFISPSWVDAYGLYSPPGAQHLSAESPSPSSPFLSLGLYSAPPRPSSPALSVDSSSSSAPSSSTSSPLGSANFGTATSGPGFFSSCASASASPSLDNTTTVFHSLPTPSLSPPPGPYDVESAPSPSATLGAILTWPGSANPFDHPPAGSATNISSERERSCEEFLPGYSSTFFSNVWTVLHIFRLPQILLTWLLSRLILALRHIMLSINSLLFQFLGLSASSPLPSSPPDSYDVKSALTPPMTPDPILTWPASANPFEHPPAGSAAGFSSEREHSDEDFAPVALVREPSSESSSLSSSCFSSFVIAAITTIAIISFFQWPFLSSFISLSWVDAYALCSPSGTQNIYPLDIVNSPVQCIVIHSGLITHTGTLEQTQSQWKNATATNLLDKFRGPLPVRYIKAGPIAVPGLSGSHAHILEYGSSLQLPLGGTKMGNEIVARVGNYILSNADAQFDKSQFVLEPSTSDTLLVEGRLGERIKNIYAFRAGIQGSARITLGSDAPVESLNPLAGFYTAITRLTPDEDSPHGPDGWFPEQRLTREEALRSITVEYLDSAYTSSTESILGSLEVGKRADYIVFEQDITTIPANEVLSTKVLVMPVDGKLRSLH
ncbi:hypothetical protein GYMLUDRAFT_53392 [Collybiopsis luxurians FD-317 M1]|nr:hypothetical protein GYMLUDRAFT_53392 [Collybiopsis luxurians FD-317 M1]